MDEKTRSEWLSLKQLVSGLNGKEFDAERFIWQSAHADLPDFLILGNVAASFHGDEHGNEGVVCFRRRPTTPGGIWPGKSPVQLVTWQLVPSAEDGAFAWTLQESSEPDDPSQPVNIFRSPNGPKGSFSTEDLASKIESRLIQHYREYVARIAKMFW